MGNSIVLSPLIEDPEVVHQVRQFSDDALRQGLEAIKADIAEV